MYITHNNHFGFGWGSGGEILNFSDKFNGDYRFKFGKAAYMPTNFRQECVRAARLIGENAKKPIIIHFSGGIDSEIVVRSFLEAEVPFEVSIMKLIYKGNTHYNSFDTVYAFDLAKKYNIRVNAFHQDIEEFIKTTYEAEAEAWKTDRLAITMQTEFVRNFSNYHNVYGGGDLKPQRYKNADKTLRLRGYAADPSKARNGLYVVEAESAVQVCYRAWECNTSTSNRFFIHTPELMLAWLLDPDVSHWIKYESALFSRWTDLNHHGIKAFVCYKHWPEMPIRPKFTGLEILGTKDFITSSLSVEATEILNRVKLKYGNQYLGSKVKIDIQDLIKSLMS